MSHSLQIPRWHERAAVRVADGVLAPLAWLRRRDDAAAAPRRVLLLRLERIGDLLMTRQAVAEARASFPGATIDLAVGSWNASIAGRLGADAVETLDVPWLAREGTGASWPALVARARGWRARGYDLVINFEPDIRSNLLAWLSGARRRVGYSSGGGGAFLTSADAYDVRAHVSVNARRLVARAAGTTLDTATPASSLPPLAIDDDARKRARAQLGAATRPLVGIHVPGGRPSKQWHPERFGEVARRLAAARGATIVLTGTVADRPLVDRTRRVLGEAAAIDASGETTLPELAALLAELDVLVTGDTGPMHLAAAVGTPVVALFGPSDPVRYGPVSDRARVLIASEVACRPCGLVRLPPERCRGHVPDCLDAIDVDVVVEAALALLDRSAAGAR